ncbi:unnamed protein product [Meloidogyne enterolobii]|uniref:Uncharacterized protein n=1 Tax=Meloidogyne enterolobii TaxID=390850 RepID=A0ACB0YJ88_MELEN
MYRQILISFILFVNFFVLPTILNARVMQEKVGLTIKEEGQLMPGISTIINRFLTFNSIYIFIIKGRDDLIKRR